MQTCECGAAEGSLGLCIDYYHAILAEEQGDPEMYRLHAPVVCTYFLQHPDRAAGKYLDGQFRQLQLLLDRGLDALLKVASHQVARNRAGSGYNPAPLAPYRPLPLSGRPTGFRSGFPDLPCPGGSFVTNGHAAYEGLILALAGDTVAAWLEVSD
ncbi:DUF5946 family protein [Kribbella sp. NPDC023855]|uniref:DUF5946 family protein n=1 Tax=Kribbella sp. NPDC023855 TaxID=3154698 RepID=UPI0033EAE4C9